MAGDVGEFQGERALEVTVEKLVVASAHTGRGDLQENLSGPGFGHGHLFDPKRFPVSVHPGCSHLHHVWLAFVGKQKRLELGGVSSNRFWRRTAPFALDCHLTASSSRPNTRGSSQPGAKIEIPRSGHIRFPAISPSRYNNLFEVCWRGVPSSPA